MSHDEFTQLDKKIDKIAAQGQQTARRLDELSAQTDRRFAELTGKVGDLTIKMEDLTGKVGSLTGKMEELSDHMLKLYQHTEGQFVSVRKEIGEVRSDVQGIYGVLDTVLKNQETEEQERLVMTHQLDRHDKWIHKIALGTSTELSYK